jgi:hypothetical protein
MNFSRPSLHPSLIQASDLRSNIEDEMRSVAKSRSMSLEAILPKLAPQDSAVLPITTVSIQTNFDAYIDISYAGSPTNYSIPLLLDSGNSVLIVPSWEEIAALPNSSTVYQVLGAAQEPWGCAANVVKGPIRIGNFQIDNCVFYACTGGPPQGGERTANFGVGCLTPWSASGWNTPRGINAIIQAPLSYTGFSVAEFNYEAAVNLISASNAPRIAVGSNITLYKSLPSSYSAFNIVPNCEWMSLIPRKLFIETVETTWPGSEGTPLIAMIDTGGGPVFLSDPDNYITSIVWPDRVQNPEWTLGSINCKSVDGSIGIELGDASGSFTYVIDPSILPAAARGLTLVMCMQNQYMRGQHGMNIGGLSALAIQIAVDYGRAQVGLRSRGSVPAV